jgi:hypothetical protein
MTMMESQQVEVLRLRLAAYLVHAILLDDNGTMLKSSPKGGTAVGIDGNLFIIVSKFVQCGTTVCSAECVSCPLQISSRSQNSESLATLLLVDIMCHRHSLGCSAVIPWKVQSCSDFRLLVSSGQTFTWRDRQTRLFDKVDCKNDQRLTDRLTGRLAD